MNNDLLNSLLRLSEAARDLAAALTELGAALDVKLAQPYREAGHPFGRDQAGIKVWLEYGQATTVN